MALLSQLSKEHSTREQITKVKDHNSVFLSRGLKAQNEDGRPATSLLLLTKAVKLLTQLPMKWLLVSRMARSRSQS